MNNKRINDPENPWNGFEVISTYTDQQAIDDGVLVAIGKENRVTRAVWNMLILRAEHTLDASLAPDAFKQRCDAYALHLSDGLVQAHGKEARRVYEQNIGGGIFSLIQFGHKLWIIPNEQGGLTLMFPEDY